MNHLTRRNSILIFTSRKDLSRCTATGNVQINTKENQKSNLYKALLFNETIDKLYTRYNAIRIQVDDSLRQRSHRNLKASQKTAILGSIPLGFICRAGLIVSRPIKQSTVTLMPHALIDSSLRHLFTKARSPFSVTCRQPHSTIVCKRDGQVLIA